jgi:hypothetical protein
MSSAKQCVPILQFKLRQAVNDGDILLERYQAGLQGIVDNVLLSKQIVPPDCSNDDDLLRLQIIDKLRSRPPACPKAHRTCSGS